MRTTRITERRDTGTAVAVERNRAVATKRNSVGRCYPQDTVAGQWADRRDAGRGVGACSADSAAHRYCFQNFPSCFLFASIIYMRIPACMDIRLWYSWPARAGIYLYGAVFYVVCTAWIRSGGLQWRVEAIGPCCVNSRLACEKSSREELQCAHSKPRKPETNAVSDEPTVSWSCTRVVEQAMLSVHPVLLDRLDREIRYNRSSSSARLQSARRCTEWVEKCGSRSNAANEVVQSNKERGRGRGGTWLGWATTKSSGSTRGGGLGPKERLTLHTSASISINKWGLYSAVGQPNDEVQR